MLCSDDLEITATNLLREYKTQSSVEKKFQQLKSPHFANALYLEVFNVGIGVKVYFLNGKKHRCLARPLKESHKKLLECLDIDENIFCWNT